LKILVDGNTEHLNNPQEFSCKKCGCIFEATNKEYSYADYIAATRDGVYAKCNCPCCGETVYLYENERRGK